MFDFVFSLSTPDSIGPPLSSGLPAPPPCPLLSFAAVPQAGTQLPSPVTKGKYVAPGKAS